METVASNPGPADPETVWQRILATLEEHHPGITALDATERNRCVVDSIKASMAGQQDDGAQTPA